MTEQSSTLQVRIAKLYVKDLSFESPSAPAVFRENWRPEIKLDVATRHRRIQEDLFEVAVELTIDAREGKDVGFIVEVEQCGIFEIKGPEGPQIERILKVFCPTTLFPYARAVVDQQLIQGGFPPLMLAPVNFEAMASRPQTAGLSPNQQPQ
jgi:preprotein translocase subunit SecB